MEWKKAILISLVVIAMVLTVYGISLVNSPAEEEEISPKIDVDIRSLPLYCQVKYTNLKGEVSYLLNPACSK